MFIGDSALSVAKDTERLGHGRETHGTSGPEIVTRDSFRAAVADDRLTSLVES